MIKTIAFDLWETLITERPGAPHVWKRLRLERIERVLAEHGVGVRSEVIEHAYHASWQRCQELYWSSDKDISCRRQVEHFLEAMDLAPLHDGAMDVLEQAYASAAIEIPPIAVSGADEVLSQLKSRGYKLGLISNTGRTPGYALRTILERLNLAGFFDAMVFSNEHGELKPQRSIFERLRQSLGAEFSEMIFVGDNVYADVHGAQRCGMAGVLFLPHERGTAVAPDVDHGLTIRPDATIRDLRELPGAIDALTASPHFAERRAK